MAVRRMVLENQWKRGASGEAKRRASGAFFNAAGGSHLLGDAELRPFGHEREWFSDLSYRTFLRWIPCSLGLGESASGARGQ